MDSEELLAQKIVKEAMLRAQQTLVNRGVELKSEGALYDLVLLGATCGASAAVDELAKLGISW